MVTPISPATIARRTALGLAFVGLLVAAGCRRSEASKGTSNKASIKAIDPKKGSIVLLGSSTSAGTGPKDPDNAWAERYADYLAQHFPDFQLVNLAVGGQTTYHIQPTGFVPPPNRPTPVRGNNITAALALSPRALIVNLPSNDSAENVPAREQMENLERIASLAKAQNVPLWVSTTQPRNFAEPAQRAAQSVMRDQIQARFAPYVLDFWKPFATAEHTIKPELDAGDGVHLNDAAHARLLEIVIAARVPETLRSVTR